MKFGKYLARRQLDLPEYANYFINYKALKKVIKKLSVSEQELPVSTPGHEIQRALQENRATFFFRLERELEKVNTFYLQKEAELRTRLNILVEKKASAKSEGVLSSKSSVTYISLHEGFLRFRRDLERLEQFIELNATGFSKVLKKWDKRSKSHTKELYLTRQVEIQPVFHREELARFSDVASASLLELEALGDGDTAIVIEETRATPAKSLTEDDLYREFIKAASNVEPDAEANRTIDEWIDQLRRMEDAKDRISKIFLSAVGSKVGEWALIKLYESGYVNIHTVDEISGKNCLHKAAGIPSNDEEYSHALRDKVIAIAFENNVDTKQVDIYGRSPLHYAALSNKQSLIASLVKHGAVIDAFDKDNFSALLYAIVNNYTDAVRKLVDLGASLSVNSDRDYIPLNLACQYGNAEIVKILLNHPPIVNVADAEGLYPIHIAARAGKHELIPLLVSYDFDVNGMDKLNQSTALGYAASEGHWQSVKALLEANADASILDENGYTPLYHAAWEGRTKCMRELSLFCHWKTDVSRCIDLGAAPAERANDDGGANVTSDSLIDTLDIMDLNTDGMDFEIPDLALPPPIIPLQRFGHNFLENKKIILQLLLNLGSRTTSFFTETASLPAGRLTISPRNNYDSIPRTLILPIAESDRSLTFQVDDLDKFGIDFEIFSTFGTRVLAKGCALPYAFAQPPGRGGQLSCQIPLMDARLRPVGDLSFRFQIVKPYSGKPLEITKYDTYWKSTSQVEQSRKAAPQVMSFVTASSVSDEYLRLVVCLTKDSVPVVVIPTNSDGAPEDLTRLVCMSLQGIPVPISNLTLAEIETLQGGSLDDDSYRAIAQTTDAKSFYSLVTQKVVPLNPLLSHLPLSVQVNIEVFYPTPLEDSRHLFGITTEQELNKYVDDILSVLFDHARASKNSINKTRSVVFSSANPEVCTLLNWKQPNYPVFFIVNAFDTSGEYKTAHGLPINTSRDEDRRCVSLKDATAFAATNNMLGIICNGRLLDLVPSIASTIRVSGLVLVADQQVPEVVSQSQSGIEGVRTQFSLKFRS